MDQIDSCLSKIIEKETEDCEPKSKISKRQNSHYQGVAFEAWINNHIYPFFDVKCNKDEVQLVHLFQCIPENLNPNQEACLKSLIVSIEQKIEPIIPIIESRKFSSLFFMEQDEVFKAPCMTKYACSQNSPIPHLLRNYVTVLKL